MEYIDPEIKRFRKRLMGIDPNDVECFMREVTEELHRLKNENENLRKDAKNLESEIKEHREREKTIRAVLVSAQKNAEQVKANAEREARLMISEAEIKAEEIIKEAGNRLIRMEQELSELRRNRIQFGAKMRSLLDAFRQMLDDDGKGLPLKLEEKKETTEQD